jgi:galactokinase
MFWDDIVENNLFLYRAKKTPDGQIVATAGMDFVGVMTGGADTLEAAVNKTYKRIGMFDFEKLYYRPKFDFMSTEYPTSILNRLKAIERFL